MARLTKSSVLALMLVFVSVTTVEAQTTDDYAARGEVLANEDPLSAELRSREPEGPSRRGFDIGMAVSEGHTADGPGKQRIRDSLTPAEQRGYGRALAFSLERNKYADLAAVGAAIAAVDPDVADARTAETDVHYWLGFDIATGIFGDPSLGAKGNTATGPGSLGIRDSLSAAGQRGFNAAVKLLVPQVAQPRPGGTGGLDVSARATRVESKNSGVIDSVIEIWRVPDVVGLSSTEAAARLQTAGFVSRSTYQDEPDASVRYGYVGSTVPAAGQLAKDGKVELRFPRAASRLGIGALATSDIVRRSGFDLDEGRYEEVFRGADIVMRKYDNEARTDENGNAYYDAGGIVIEPSDGAYLTALYDVRHIDQYGLGSFLFQAECERELKKRRLTRASISNPGGAPATICVMTSKQQIAVLQFRPGDNVATDNYKFHHAIFPRQLNIGVSDRITIPKKS